MNWDGLNGLFLCHISHIILCYLIIHNSLTTVQILSRCMEFGSKQKYEDIYLEMTLYCLQLGTLRDIRLFLWLNSK